MKIGLGAVQFGMDYGISNPGGKTPLIEVERILQLAAEHDVSVIDTAAQYGSSEEVLGQALASGQGFRIVTKTPSFRRQPIEARDAQALEETFASSLQRLRLPSVYGLLIHHCEDLLAPGGEQLFSAMRGLKERGLVQKIGVSIYTPEQVDWVLERFAIDLIQIPINVLDQRLVFGGQLTRLKQRGVEVHARSVFLQGLLLMEPSAIPAYFTPWLPHLVKYWHFLEQNELTPLAGALAFLGGLEEIDVCLCGVNTAAQLAEILRSASAKLPPQAMANFALKDPAILNPGLWKQ